MIGLEKIFSSFDMVDFSLKKQQEEQQKKTQPKQNHFHV